MNFLANLPSPQKPPQKSLLAITIDILLLCVLKEIRHI